jgi:hypothetical protein
MRIPCSNENVNFFGKKPLVLFSQCSNFVNKINNILGIKRKEIGHEKIKCLFFVLNWVYTMNKCI